MVPSPHSRHLADVGVWRNYCSIMAEKSAIPAQPTSRTVDAEVAAASGIDDAVVWALLDAAPDGLVIVDEDGRMRLVNRRVEELFGFDRGDLFNEPIETLLP